MGIKLLITDNNVHKWRQHRDLGLAAATKLNSFKIRKDRLPQGELAPHNVWFDPAGIFGEVPLAEVRIFDGESIDSALRRFKRQVQQEGIIKEVKKHSYYLKPGEKKRLKSAMAQKLKRKKVRRQPAETDTKAPPRSSQY